MGSGVVVVTYEAPVHLEQVRLSFVRLVERLYLANGCGPADARSDMLIPSSLQCLANSDVPPLAGLN